MKVLKEFSKSYVVQDCDKFAVITYFDNYFVGWNPYKFYVTNSIEDAIKYAKKLDKALIEFEAVEVDYTNYANFYAFCQRMGYNYLALPDPED
jgi:hypothetical protein